MRWTGPVPRTTWVAGLCLAAAALLELVVASRVEIPVTETVLVPVRGPWLGVPAALLQAAGLVVLARGVRAEPGAAGTSRIGRIALLVLAAQQPLSALLGLVPPPAGAIAFPLGVFGAFDVVFVVAGIVAAIAVVRAAVLRGAARWLLLPLAIVQPVVAALFFAEAAALSIPALRQEVGAVAAAVPLELLPALLLLAFAGSLLLHGRTAAVRERLTAIRAAW